MRSRDMQTLSGEGSRTGLADLVHMHRIISPEAVSTRILGAARPTVAGRPAASARRHPSSAVVCAAHGPQQQQAAAAVDRRALLMAAGAIMASAALQQGQAAQAEECEFKIAASGMQVSGRRLASFKPQNGAALVSRAIPRDSAIECRATPRRYQRNNPPPPPAVL